MITSDDERPRHEDDDPLATLLRPEPLYLSPPPGCYEAIHRGATRRRLVSAATTAGATLAVVAVIAALVALPRYGNTPGDPRPSSPVFPVAPPPDGHSQDTETPEPSTSVVPRPSDDELTTPQEQEGGRRWPEDRGPASSDEDFADEDSPDEDFADEDFADEDFADEDFASDADEIFRSETSESGDATTR